MRFGSDWKTLNADPNPCRLYESFQDDNLCDIETIPGVFDEGDSEYS